MHRVEVSFGIGFNRFGQLIHPANANIAVKDIINFASTMFGGCTVLHGQGGWLDPNSKLVVENNRTIVVYTEDGSGIAPLIDFIKAILEQEAVAVCEYAPAAATFSIK